MCEWKVKLEARGLDPAMGFGVGVLPLPWNSSEWMAGGDTLE